MTIDELKARVHELTGLNVRNRSRPWLEAKLKKVAEDDATHETITHLARQAGEAACRD